ncbi:MAG: Translocation and assembly module TamB, partial [Pseudomonadota bacterium]
GLSLRMDGTPQWQVWLERERGDWQWRAEGLGSPRVPAGLREARAQLTVQGTQAALDLRWDSEHAGQLDAHLDSRVASAGPMAELWPSDAPLAGHVQARLPQVGAWSWLAPPGWRVQGGVDARMALAGTRSQPRWQGTLQADDLLLRSAIEGIELRQGRLRARLQEQALWLDELTLQGAGAQGGELRVQGRVQWLPQDGPLWSTVQMDVQAQARALRVSSRADRRLTVSGQSRAQWQSGQMRLTGELQADSALFILPEDSAPSLGADVVVLPTQPGKTTPVGGPSLIGTPEVHVLLRLGPDFQLRGHGIRTRLAGELQLRSGAASQGQPRLSGDVRTVGGRYKAYGQELDVEQGLLRFAGPYDNPALDILALRPQLSQRVGVRVTGTALAPRVRLYADPSMPDADTLAWLVLGRAPAAGGAESALLQQAALALLGSNGQSLGGEMATALGLDTLSLANRSVSNADGSTSSGAALMLGKRLSKDFYLAYESSVGGAFGSLFMFYELSRRLSLRAQTGPYNALDLVYTVRHD